MVTALGVRLPADWMTVPNSPSRCCSSDQGITEGPPAAGLNLDAIIRWYGELLTDRPLSGHD